MVISKQAIPISVACGVMWALSQLVFNAGSKVSTNEAVVTQLQKDQEKNWKEVQNLQLSESGDHDKLVTLLANIDDLKDQIAKLESQNIGKVERKK